MVSDGLKKLWTALVFAGLMSVSCSPYGKDVREALRHAGDNRGELEQVMEHYSHDKSDSLKRKAALYLIGNMTWHRSYPAEAYSRYCREMDSVSVSDMPQDSMKQALEEISSRYARSLVPVFDVRTVTADYLIWNIDYSFEVWENTDWLRHLDFRQFCEYVLPYKCVDLQPLTKWKEESLKTIAIYRKGLEIATSPKIKNLVEKYKEYKENYGENDKKTLKIAKKIDDETHKIYNN